MIKLFLHKKNKPLTSFQPVNGITQGNNTIKVVFLSDDYPEAAVTVYLYLQEEGDHDRAPLPIVVPLRCSRVGEFEGNADLQSGDYQAVVIVEDKLNETELSHNELPEYIKVVKPTLSRDRYLEDLIPWINL